MKAYLRWSLKQLYLLFFWPTRFKREFEGNSPRGFKHNSVQTIRYILGLLPWVVALAVLGNTVGGYVCELFGVPINWERSWAVIPFGIGAGMGLGPVGIISVVGTRAAGVDFVTSLWISVAMSVTFLVVFGVARGVSVVIASGVAFGAAFGITMGAGEFIAAKGFFSASLIFVEIVGVVIGTTFGMLLSLGFGSEFRVKFGLMICAAFGGTLGVAFFAADARVGFVGVVMASLMIGSAFTLGYFRLLAYPFDVALSVAAYITGRWQPRMAMRAWRWCPVAWNELIWLPVPLANKLLALTAKQDRTECFKQIAFVATERKLQRHVAMAAMVEVAFHDLQVSSVADLADIPDRINWTRDTLGSELPAELATTVTVLDRVAQCIGQYLTLHSTYRKGQALERAIREMGEIQLYLIAMGGRSARRLLDRANQWRALLEGERQNLRKLTEIIREIPNPFVFGNPVMQTEHNLFSGRKDIVKQIEASVLGKRQPPTLLLYGPRRIGKTSILCQLPRLIGPDFAPALVDCQNPAAIGSEILVLRYLSRALSQGLRLRRLCVEPLTETALAREPFSAFDEWLDVVEREMPEKMRALLCLDEYERLQSTLDAGWGKKLLDALRHTIQHRSRVVLMFTGTHTFQELGPDWTDRFINARRVRVGFLRKEDVELLLKAPIPEFNMTYAPGAIDAVIAATNCQPFLTQAVAFELVQLINEQKRKEATLDDIEISVARAIVSGGEYFANVWSEAGEQGQIIMSAIAKGETPPAFQEAREWLLDHDILNNDGGFTVDMMRCWVRIHSL